MAAPLTQYHPHRLFLESAESNGSFPREGDFNSNMMMVIAGLLCALFFAIGMNSLMRCCLRCGYRFAYGTPDHGRNVNATAGLKKSALKEIPVVAYDSGVSIPGTDCAICIGEFVEGERVRILPKCSHGFHVQCIDTWLVSHTSCPLCRQPLLDQETSCNFRAQLPENGATANASLVATQ